MPEVAPCIFSDGCKNQADLVTAVESDLATFGEVSESLELELRICEDGCWEAQKMATSGRIRELPIDVQKKLRAAGY